MAKFGKKNLINKTKNILQVQLTIILNIFGHFFHGEKKTEKFESE